MISIPYELKDSIKELIIEVPSPAAPKDYGINNDTRKIGLANERMVIEETK